MHTLETMRTFKSTNCEQIHDMAIYRRDTDDTLWLHDLTADPMLDGLVQIGSCDDTDIEELISPSGFELL